MVPEGKICAVGQVMIVIDDGKGQAAQPVESKGNGHSHAAAPIVQQPAATPTATAAPAGDSGARVLATPRTRKIAREMGVDLRSVTPTGRNGRVTTDDLHRHAKSGPTSPSPSPSPSPTPDFRSPESRIPESRTPISIPAGPSEERIPFRGMRKAIAANMTRSKFTATHFTYVEEVDMTDLVALRGRAKAKAAERGVKLTYLPFFVKAAVAGLKKWPSINASLDEVTQEIVHKKYYHLGIATQGPQGLSVGVVRDADKRSIFDLAREIQRISDAIRDGKASRDELTGSTFTISSLGQLGGVLATPIINFPESAIMGVHKIAEKPAIHEGQIVARHLMNLSISVDHRIADGYDGAMFLQEVKTYLEDPTLMFMEMV
jgi:pyruvate dehydrogenase E2 component (dihydrolipoamide acetyltransferase)